MRNYKANAIPRSSSPQSQLLVFYTHPQTTLVGVMWSHITSWPDVRGAKLTSRAAGGCLRVVRILFYSFACNPTKGPLTEWETGCTTYNTSGVPTTLSTTGINIPSWAFDIPTGTTWNPAEASSAAVPNGFTPSTTARWYTYTNTDDSSTHSAEGAAIGRALAAAVIVPIILWCLIGLSILCSIAGCIAHCQRQTRRRKLYGPMNAYYLAQNAGLYYGPYRANANQGAFGSAAPLLHPNQPQPPPSAHLSYQGFSSRRTSFIRSPQPPPAEMTQLGSAPLVRAEPAVTMPTSGMDTSPYSPVVRGGFGEASGSGRRAGGEVDEGGDAREGTDVQRPKSVSYGGHAASFYGAHMATAMEGNHGVEETPQRLLPYAGGREEALTESKGKEKAS
ncbi:hypothetical protein M408DRAFT_27565 [Serendipita vermifera MAFF 305830]|uniref:Uncharacterized protein n=1 Tax=Serendipita vermifera MAFF 305830 TaxID=933852 RepID=A0A0C2WBP6_SERVB|nr:hypothetical protein M408DRAFT_27565 [Serendipita vermifera MAFF 305830]